MEKNKNKIVLQKFIADSGYSSRRQAAELIRSGQVKVNGQTAELGQKVFLNDEIIVKGKKLESRPERIYIIINKPAGYVCTNRAFKGEKNVFDLLIDQDGNKLKQRLFAVGRLDKVSHGLLLLTNDGELAQRIAHPRFEHEKEYIVKVKSEKLKVKSYPVEMVQKLKKGLKIDGKFVKVKEGEYLGEGKFKIVLTQGIKRQIRLMFKALGLEVADLERTRIGCGGCDLGLDRLKCGEWRKLKIEEIERLKK